MICAPRLLARRARRLLGRVSLHDETFRDIQARMMGAARDR